MLAVACGFTKRSLAKALAVSDASRFVETENNEE
jgi:hypothetical protein